MSSQPKKTEKQAYKRAIADVQRGGPCPITGGCPLTWTDEKFAKACQAHRDGGVFHLYSKYSSSRCEQGCPPGYRPPEFTIMRQEEFKKLASTVKPPAQARKNKTQENIMAGKSASNIGTCEVCFSERKRLSTINDRLACGDCVKLVMAIKKDPKTALAELVEKHNNLVVGAVLPTLLHQMGGALGMEEESPSAEDIASRFNELVKSGNEALAQKTSLASRIKELEKQLEEERAQKNIALAKEDKVKLLEEHLDALTETVQVLVPEVSSTSELPQVIEALLQELAAAELRAGCTPVESLEGIANPRMEERLLAICLDIMERESNEMADMAKLVNIAQVTGDQAAVQNIVWAHTLQILRNAGLGQDADRLSLLAEVAA